MANASHIVTAPPDVYHTVLLRLLDRDATHVQAIFYEDNGDVAVLPPMVLSLLPPLNECACLVVVLPGDCVRIVNASLPKKYPSKQLPTLVKYALEDSLLGDVEGQHVAIFFDTVQAQQVTAAIIDKTLFQAILDRLSAHSVSPTSVITEGDMLACPAENTWQVGVTQTHFIVRMGLAKMGVVAIPHAALLLQQCLAENDSPQKIGLQVIDSPLPDPLKVVLFQQTGIEIENIAWDWTPYFLETMLTRNLLQGEFQRQKPGTKAARLRRVVYCLAFAAGFFSLMQQAWSYWAWHRLAQAYQQKIEAIYSKRFPTSNAVLAPLSRFEQALKLANASGAKMRLFLSLLSRFTQALQGSSNAVVLVSLDYQESALFLVLLFDNEDTLKALTMQLARVGVHVTEKTKSASGSQLQATLVLT